MSYEIEKTELPASELGDERCFQIEYYGHGDIRIATWSGSIELDPINSDDRFTAFGMAHGSDVDILASMAGYLRRLGDPEETVKQVLSEAGEDVLSDDPEYLRHYHSLARYSLRRIANGESTPRFDLPELGLDCLVVPIPNQPGVLSDVGGTGIYTKHTEDDLRYVLVAHSSVRHETGKSLQVVRSAEFCRTDIPSMARAVCDLALGEYRRDIQAFLTNLYQEDLD